MVSDIPCELKQFVTQKIQSLDKSARVFVWGAGLHGRWVMDRLGANGIGFIDSNPTKHSSVIGGKNVFSPEEALNEEYDLVLICMLSDPESIAEYLHAKGLKENHEYLIAFPNGKLIQFISRIDEYLSFLQGIDCADKVFLEVGSGGQLFLAMLFVLLGARKIIVTDVVAYPQSIIEKYRSLYEEFFTFIVKKHARFLGNKIDFEACFKKIEFIYEPYSADNLPFDNVSFDCVYNTGVMEHLNDSFSAIREFRRVLKSQGYVLLMAIGIHDHRSNDPNSDFTPWSFLEYTEEEWSQFVHNPYHQNRWRAIDFKQALKKEGFIIEKYQTMLNKSLKREDIDRFSERFKSYSYHELIEMNLFLAAAIE